MWKLHIRKIAVIREIAKVTKIAEMDSMPDITEMVIFVKIVESWQKGLK